MLFLIFDISLCVTRIVHPPKGTHYIKKKKLTLDQVSVGLRLSLFLFLKIAMLNTPRFQTRSLWAHKWVQMYLLFKERGAGHEIDNWGAALHLVTHSCPGSGSRFQFQDVLRSFNKDLLCAQGIE